LPELADRITTIIVNYKTATLTKACYNTFRAAYSTLPIILIDNFSRDDSTKYIKSIGKSDPLTTSIFHSTNLGHGPAMNVAIKSIRTPFVFTLDSDCEILKGGVIEAMMQKMDTNANLYAIGWLRWVDKRTGVPYSWHTKPKPPKTPYFNAYIHPYAAIYRLSMYRQLRPFFDHGAPCLHNMIDAVDRRFDLESFKLEPYVKHHIAGTRRMFKDYWHPKDDEAPKPWVAKGNHPI